MASMNRIDHRSRQSRPDTLDEAQLRDALGELVVEASGYRDGRCSVQHLNAALKPAQGALDAPGEHGKVRTRLRL